jgi:hypothetical protein
LRARLARVNRPRRVLSRISRRLRDWHRDANYLTYLSDYERWLNRSLWALLAVSLVYIIFQHILLANVPEAFRGATRLGAVCYDLAIAYTGAFTFYVLIIRLPLRRDRRNVYRHLPELIDQFEYNAGFFMSCLNNAAGFGHLVRRENTLANVQEMCKRLTLDSRVAAVLPSSDANFNSTLVDVFDSHIARTRILCREILGFSSFLDSDLIDHIFGIEYCSFFKSYEGDLLRLLRRITSPGEPDPRDLSRWAEGIVLYLQAVDDLANYRHTHLTRQSSRRIVKPGSP